MKQLFTKTIPVLFLLSLIFSSCDKENPANPANPGTATFWINYKYTPKTPPQTEQSGSGNITNGQTGVMFHLDPYLHGSGICNDGKWSYKVQAPAGNTWVASQDPKTGKVDFITGTPGTYTITITYTCPDGTSYSASISITVA